MSRAQEESVSEGAEPSASPQGGSKDFKWYQSVPIASSIGGGDCVLEEAKNLEIFVREPAPNSGLDRAARCTKSGKIQLYASLMVGGTIFVTISRRESYPIAHTSSKK